MLLLIRFFILKKAKNCYSAGLKLFNEQQLINMNQEKARKCINEIEEWISQLETIDFSSLNEDDATSTDSSLTNQFISNFSTNPNDTLSDDNNNDIRKHCKHNSNCNKLKQKENCLVKNFELTCSQIKSLGSLFEKRQDQLKKIAFPIISKPVQRVEPHYNEQTLNNSTLSSASSTSSASSSTSSVSTPNQNGDTGKFNSNLIKRDSMQKVNELLFS